MAAMKATSRVVHLVALMVETRACCSAEMMGTCLVELKVAMKASKRVSRLVALMAGMRAAPKACY